MEQNVGICAVNAPLLRPLFVKFSLGSFTCNNRSQEKKNSGNADNEQVWQNSAHGRNNRFTISRARTRRGSSSTRTLFDREEEDGEELHTVSNVSSRSEMPRTQHDMRHGSATFDIVEANALGEIYKTISIRVHASDSDTEGIPVHQIIGQARTKD